LNASLKLKGQKQANQRSVTRKGREDSIAVIAVSHEVVSPRTRRPAGNGQADDKPLVITQGARQELAACSTTRSSPMKPSRSDTPVLAS